MMYIQIMYIHVVDKSSSVEDHNPHTPHPPRQRTDSGEFIIIIYKTVGWKILFSHKKFLKIFAITCEDVENTLKLL